ncbi:hypothetical protein EGW08_016142 [Elysia chlorotica]|uniref:Uncharacterized protein n=1 Tax=Elysia chlorotica TaxID=188477 RepID=A0A3S0ZVA7_ELYCH|nr:hypothetical protein EGW08_016142 [Elysia chlorotica]
MSKALVSAATKKSATPKLQDSATTTGKATPNSDASSPIKQPKKRRRTFELEEPTLGAANTPTSEPAVGGRQTRSGSRTNTPTDNGPTAKRQRRNTYDKSDSAAEGVSPGTASMIASMDASQDSAERKANLLSAIDRKIQSKAPTVAASPNGPTSQPSQIPRFMAYLASMKKEAQQQQRPVTPGSKDWTKIHKKAFSKFDSIDVYLEKKQQRKDLLSGSGKRLNSALPKVGNTKIARPVSKPQQTVKPFVPTVTSVKKMTFNFGATPRSQARNPQTGAKASVKSNAFSASTNTSRLVTPATNTARKSVGSTNRATPFKFTGGTTDSKLASTSASQKSAFDLKASLARPLSWKPHTGKLQPLDFNTTTAATSRPVDFNTTRTIAPADLKSRSRPVGRPSRQALAAKTRPTNVKDVRRVQQLDRRNNQKYIDMMRRRGLMA